MDNVQHLSPEPFTINDMVINETPMNDMTICWQRCVSQCHNMSVEEVDALFNWPLSSDLRCLHCTYNFPGVPVPLPTKYDKLRNVYICTGIFCSWQCAKAYNLTFHDVNARNRGMYIALLAYQTWVKHKEVDKHNEPSVRSHVRRVYEGIHRAPDRRHLVDYGGTMTIEEFRKGSFGILPPDEVVEDVKPYMTLRNRHALAFQNLASTDISSPVDVGGTLRTTLRRGLYKSSSMRTSSKNITSIKPIANSQPVPSARPDSQARANPPHVHVLSRKRPALVKNTLMDTMGIQIKRHNR
jgi:hypothetical protein